MADLKLNPEGKRSFLEHCLKLITDGRSVKFLKLPFISKEFLKAAKLNPFYILTVHRCLKIDRFNLRFMDVGICKSYSAFDTFSAQFHRPYFFDLSNAQTRSLVRLLQPRYLCADINGFFFPPDLMDEYKELFDSFNGQLLLFLTGFNKKFYKLVERVAPRLHVLYSMPMLLTDRSMPLMKLDCYGSIGPVDADQLQGILRHNIQTLCLSSNYRFDVPSAGANRELSAVNNSLYYLNIDCSTHWESLMPLVDCVKKLCPTLDIVSVYSKSYVQNLASSNEITECVLDRYADIQDLMEDCRSLVSELYVNASVKFHFSPGAQYNSKWIGNVRKQKIFKNFAYKKKVHTLPSNTDRLSLKMADDFLTLNYYVSAYQRNFVNSEDSESDSDNE